MSASLAAVVEPHVTLADMPTDAVRPVACWVEGVGEGTVEFAAWPEHLAIQGMSLPPGAPAGTAAAIVAAILERYPTPPQRFTHADVNDRGTLEGYAASSWRDAVVVCGALGERACTYDALTDVLARPGGGEPAGVTIMGDRDFASWLSDGAPAEELARVLVQSTWLTRVVVLRRAAGSRWLRAIDIDRLHHLALTDDASAVRQFAAVQMSRMYPELAYLPAFDRIVGAMADPLAWPGAWCAARTTTAEGQIFQHDRARHHLRLALLWVAGNLSWMADGYHAPGVEAPGALGLALREELARNAADWSPARERRAAVAAVAALEGEPAALGHSEPLRMLDAARFVVLRARAYAASAGEERDPLDWLLRSVEALVPPGAAGSSAAVLYA